MWEILSERPVFFKAAIESPPPTIEIAPFSVAAATAFATSRVPFANASNSNTPTGPFQIIVFAPSSAFTYSFEVSGPESSPCQSSGHWSTGTTLWFASAANLSATTKSTGRTTFTPFFSAFSRRPFARSILSGSQRDLPTPRPLAASNVWAMPPPMMIVSTLSMRFEITPILSETFEPPIIATNGRAGFSRVLPI